MSQTWYSGDEPVPPPRGVLGWAFLLTRFVLLGSLTFGGLALLLLVRLVERPVFGMTRPVTPYITRVVCRSAFVILGIDYRVTGRPMTGPGAVVANHSSWLDIFALNARKNIYFVSKSEVAGWPGIGLLAKATGTVFINRDRREARAQKELFEARLAAGHRLLFFPEGTSTDGQRVLPFKSTLFAAFFTEPLHHTARIQPVSVIYRAPRGQDPRFYGWWGDMDFGSHLLKVLSAPRHGSVELVYHPPVPVSETADRKDLALRLEEAVRSGVSAALSADETAERL